jgi:hypothetical protein
MRFSLRAAVLLALGFSLLAPGLPPLRAQHSKDLITVTPLNSGDTLVLGFLGGITKWNEENRPVRELALRLREMNLPGVYVETFEHGRRHLALKLIEAAIGRDTKGKFDAQGRRNIRIILFGHSMGGAAVVKLARQLKKLDVPVALTVQVDSVGASDAVIPFNVARAANLFQHDSKLLHGRGEIRAEDPKRTEILANLQYTYDGKWVDLSRARVPEQIVRTRHTKMEFDPEVWEKVESYIQEELRRPPAVPARP